MQFIPFRATGLDHPFHITYSQIKAAMKKASKSKKPVKGRKYAVMDVQTGETYSPKALLKLVIGERRFHSFGFPVGNREFLNSERAKKRKPSGRVDSTNVLLERLFSRTWKLFPSVRELQHLEDYPGVYMLAYSDTSLDGTRVKEKDVFYVGMACEGGLRSRLKEFRKGITDGRCHSGAMRFHRIWLKGEPYRPNGKARFYFVYVPVKCERVKEWRSPSDILRMSKVPELELAAIAQVKSKMHHEPLLNWK